MEHHAQTPVFVLRPSLLNALLPSYAKHLFWCILIVGAFVIGSLALSAAGLTKVTLAWGIPASILGAALLAILPSAWKIFVLRNTRYVFYKTHLVSEFKFLTVKRRSVLYSSITNITAEITLWDRLCNAGDIVVHTGEDSEPDLVLQFIPKPEEVEHRIYKLAHGTHTNA